jgi:hypothetical protein
MIEFLKKYALGLTQVCTTILIVESSITSPDLLEFQGKEAVAIN